MLKKIIAVFINFVCLSVCFGQELFTYTEPASNMAAKSIGVRINNTLMYDNFEKENTFHALPEVMFGLSKNLMMHAEGFLSTRKKALVAEGGAVYLKYRFYSVDDVHSHFRMAVFARYANNNSEIHQQAIDLNGHNSGYELGCIATKLINKTALSSSVSLLHADDNAGNNIFNYPSNQRNAVGYTFSVGKLMIPKEYVSYKQVNMNAMLETLCQTNLETGRTYADVAPVIQLIFLSRMRADFSYRLPISKALYRTAPEGALLRFEYNFFNAF